MNWDKNGARSIVHDPSNYYSYIKGAEVALSNHDFDSGGGRFFYFLYRSNLITPSNQEYADTARRGYNKIISTIITLLNNKEYDTILIILEKYTLYKINDKRINEMLNKTFNSIIESAIAEKEIPSLLRILRAHLRYFEYNLSHYIHLKALSTGIDLAKAIFYENSRLYRKHKFQQYAATEQQSVKNDDSFQSDAQKKAKNENKMIVDAYFEHVLGDQNHPARNNRYVIASKFYDYREWAINSGYKMHLIEDSETVSVYPLKSLSLNKNLDVVKLSPLLLVEAKDVFVYSLENGIIVSKNGDCFSKRNPVGQYSSHPRYSCFSVVLNDFFIMDIDNKNDHVYESGFMLFYSVEYYHFLLDYAHFIEVYKNFFSESSVPIVVFGAETAIVSEILNILGVKNPHIIFIHSQSAVKFKKLYMPLGRYLEKKDCHFQNELSFSIFDEKRMTVSKSASKINYTYQSLSGINFLRKMSVLNRQRIGGKKIFISRADVGRNFPNESDVSAALSALGFEIVIPGKLKIEQQIDIFYNADIVVGQEGGGLANIVFCNEGALIIELRTPLMCHMGNYMENLANIIGLVHTDILCAEKIDLDKILEAIDEFSRL